MDQNAFDNHIMRLVLLEAYKSIEQFKVGSCVVDQNGTVVATGYNRLLPNAASARDSFGTVLGWKSFEYSCINLAAESALSCAHMFPNCTLYLNTIPSPFCIKEMVKKGITGLVYYRDFRDGYHEMYKATECLQKTQEGTLTVRYFYAEDEDDLTRSIREIVIKDNRSYMPKP